MLLYKVLNVVWLCAAVTYYVLFIDTHISSYIQQN
jgi:hypothetical protein